MLVTSYFIWRQQEASLAALDIYCAYVLSEDNTADQVTKLLQGLGPREKEEILRQNEIAYEDLPPWQRWGTGVRLVEGGRVAVDTSLPRDDAYGPYLKQFLD